MKKESLDKKEEKKVLVFSVAGEEYGLDISCVREVLRPQKIYPLPKIPDFVEGVIHLRGHIVALIDLRKRLHGKPGEDEPYKRIIICRVGKFIVGLTVNTLKEIIALSKEEMKTIPEVVSMQMEADVISGMARVGQRIIPILNLEYILTKKEVSELSALQR
jgi:purine-binding chemotaxis protein CheW